MPIPIKISRNVPKTVLLLFALLFLAPLLSHAEGDDYYRDDLYRMLESDKKSVFVAQCGSKTAKYAIMLNVVGQKDWELYEERGGVVVNVGSFRFEGGDAVDLETNGGIYSYARVHHLIRELVNTGFDLLSPFTVEKLKALKIRKPKCKYDNSEYFDFYSPDDPAHDD